MIELHPTRQPPTDTIRIHFSPTDARIVLSDDAKTAFSVT
jgi:hypothetical protein